MTAASTFNKGRPEPVAEAQTLGLDFAGDDALAGFSPAAAGGVQLGHL
jgi:hypothetical protein